MSKIKLTATTRNWLERVGEKATDDREYEATDAIAIASVSQAISLKRIANSLDKFTSLCEKMDTTLRSPAARAFIKGAAEAINSNEDA